MRLAPVFCLVVAVLLISGTEAAIYRGTFKKPEHPGKCVFIGMVLNPLQEVRHAIQCARILCLPDGEVEINTCGVQVLPSNLHFGRYLYPMAYFPACCDREVLGN